MKVTRGEGLLEEFLAGKRASMANKLLLNTKHGKILDVGCGSFPYFLTTVNFEEKYGIDYSKNLAPEDLPGIRIKKINVEEKKFPFKDNFFDAVTMLAVFEHINEDKLDGVLSECRRVLKDGGLFIITTPSPWSDTLLHFMARIGLISAEEIHEHKHNLTHKNVVNILNRVGFTREKINNGFFETGFNMWFKAKKSGKD